MWKIPLFKLSFGCEEMNAVKEVISSEWLTMGPRTSNFEAAFTDYLGDVTASSTAVSSCTAALHLALLALGIGPGDEVIVPALTFVAAVNVVQLVGATPVLADSTSLEDWNVSASSIEERITSKTKAVIIVHFAGEPCDMESIRSVTEKAGVPLIEDCAHAIGASWFGQKCGVIGDIGCFSFFSNKNLSTGEGGMIVTRNPAIAEKVRLLRSHGMTSLTIDRHLRKAISYDVVTPGLNYRIDEIRSALGIVQLGKLDGMNDQRRQAAVRYMECFTNQKKIVVPWQKPRLGFVSSHHIFPVLLPTNVDREGIIKRLANEGVQTSIHYPGFRGFSAYRDAGLLDTPIADEICSRTLTLPLYPEITPEEVVYVSDRLLTEFFSLPTGAN